MVAGVPLVADIAGALYWPEEGLLVVSDLHLEKGSAFAVRGVLMPPYDTATTLDRLAGLLARYAARIVVALGDNFHDGGGPARLAGADRAHLLELQRGRDWVWIAGNHDPDPREGIGGAFARSPSISPPSVPATGRRRRQNQRQEQRPARQRDRQALAHPPPASTSAAAALTHAKSLLRVERRGW
jgi:hypothetical protein